LKFKILYIQNEEIKEKDFETKEHLDEYYINSFYEDFVYSCKKVLKLQVLSIIPLKDDDVPDSKNLYVSGNLRKVFDFDLKEWLEKIFEGREVVYKNNQFRRIR
jgi:hypothetical protein